MNRTTLAIAALTLATLSLTPAFTRAATIRIQPLNPAFGQLPEDVHLSPDKQTLYASFFPANELGVYDRRTLHQRATITVPAPTGITLDTNGDILVATAPWFRSVLLTGAPDPATASSQGVWRITPCGTATLIATLPFDNDLPNGIAVDRRGNIYVSNLIGDQIYRVDPAGSVTLWAENALFAGDPSTDPGSPSAGFPAGGNGIQIIGSNLFLSNTDAGSILRVPINPNGSAGSVSVYVRDRRLIGTDGFKIDASGFIYTASPLTSEIKRVSPRGAIETLATFADGLRASSGLDINSYEHPTRLFFCNFSPPFSFLDPSVQGQPGLGLLLLAPSR